MFETHLGTHQAHVPAELHADEWSTPLRIFEPLHEEFGFTLDVCASLGNAKCPRFLTRDVDGLSVSWDGETVWMNPPYGRGIIDLWMKKALDSARHGGTTTVCLVPSSTSAAWWHDYALKGEIRYVRGRIKFGGATSAAMFSNAVVIFRPSVSA